jgi:hypothetical protein
VIEFVSQCGAASGYAKAQIGSLAGFLESNTQTTELVRA